MHGEIRINIEESLEPKGNHNNSLNPLQKAIKKRVSEKLFPWIGKPINKHNIVGLINIGIASTSNTFSSYNVFTDPSIDIKLSNLCFGVVITALSVFPFIGRNVKISLNMKNA